MVDVTGGRDGREARNPQHGGQSRCMLPAGPRPEVCQPTGWAARLVIAQVHQDPNDENGGSSCVEV
jgi:hypothetical protein